MKSSSSAAEAESVRELEDWKPFYKEPPTGRLFLDLERVGHGKSPEQKYEFDKLRLNSRDSKRAAPKEKPVGSQSCTELTPSDKPAPPQTRPLLSPAQICHDIIIPNLVRSENLDKQDKKVLHSQLKVLEKLSARCKNPNDTAARVLSLFRQCDPDEFGFVSKEKFLAKVVPEFALNRAQAEELFLHNQTSLNGSEMNYLEFREAFKRLDRNKEHIPDTHRPLMNRSAAPKANIKVGEGAANSKHNFLLMSVEEREEYRQRSRIHDMFEQGRRKMLDFFNQREGDPGQREKNLYVRTKLTFPEISSYLSRYGCDIAPDKLEQLYKKSPDEKALTFSQLCRRTEDYFKTVSGEEMSLATRNMELRGQFLGCRARGEAHDKVEPPRSLPAAEFLAHHATPRETTPPLYKKHVQVIEQSHKRAREQHESALKAAGERLATVDEDIIWKGRWLDKTIDGKNTRNTLARTEISDKMQKGCGPAQFGWDPNAPPPTPKERPEPQAIAKRMQQGSGDIFSWQQSGRGTQRDAFVNQILLGTSRDTARALENKSTARDTARETARENYTARGTGRSSIHVLPTPYGTERDLS